MTKKELERILEISPAPLRDALERLSMEGLVEILPQRGLRIIPVDLTMIKETFQFRIALEVACAPATIQSGAAAGVEALSARTADVLARLRAAPNPQTMTEAGVVDLDMHRFIIDAAGNGMMQHAYRQLADRIVLIQRRGHCTSDTMISAMSEHTEILEAMRRRDLARAQSLLEAHLKASMIKSMGL